MNLFKWRSGNKSLAPLHKVTSDVITTKRRNWQSGSFRIQRTKHSGNTGVPCLEDTSASSSSSANDDAPWRVENILPTGAPRESDWWGTDDEVSVIDEDDAEKDDEIAKSSCSSPKRSTDVSLTSRRFKNCGFETWKQAREAWLVEGTLPVERKSTAVMSKAAKRELKKGLTNNRQFELKQNMSLKDIVGAYNEIWSEEPTE